MQKKLCFYDYKITQIYTYNTDIKYFNAIQKTRACREWLYTTKGLTEGFLDS